MQDIEKLKEWQAVMKRVENDKLREEQEGRSRDLLAAEHRRSALEKVLAKLQVRVETSNKCICYHAQDVLSYEVYRIIWAQQGPAGGRQ